ncbi:flavodoxin family protein [Methanobrevibacter sp.]|uniref:flavodoxin family protein n=1 Tax=Methanobrevibacter sp. TaxID=66852 RepID=UPI00388ED510
MKYLIINGSPRKKNTWSIVKQIESNLDGEFEEVHLIKEKIPLCNGCFKCFEEGESECPHFEFVNPIVEKIKECDGLIITSPVYALNVTGLLKNFFDHTAYFYHRPSFFDKKALVAVSTAGAGHNKVAKYIDETLRHWGFNKNYKIAIAFGAREHPEAKEIDKIDKTAQRFRKDLESKKLHGPKFMDLIFYNAWRAMTQADEPNLADKEYWENTDLVNHEFAPIVKLNIIQRMCGKLFFFIFKRMF